MKRFLPFHFNWTWAFLALFTLLCLVLSSFTAVRLRALLRSDAEASLASAAANNVHRVDLQLQQGLSDLQLTASVCAAMPDDQDRLDHLTTLVEQSGVDALGLFTGEGEVFLTDGNRSALTGALLRASQEDVPTIRFSNTLSPDGETELIYLVPFSSQPGGVLCRVRASLPLQIPEPFPGFQNAPVVVDPDGTVLAQEGEVLFSPDLFTALKLQYGADPLELEEMADTMASGGKGALRFRMDGRSMALAYAPLSVDNWYLVTVMDVESNQAPLYKALWITILGDIILLAAFLFLFLHARRSQQQSMVLLEKAAYVDPVTGGHNQTRFLILAQEALDAQPPGTYALVSCDIQAFSLVNRSFGKAAGNQVLYHLNTCLRQKLRSDELVGRVAQDQFILLLRQDQEAAMRTRLSGMASVFNAYNDTLANPYYLPLTMGVCRCDPQDPATLSELCDRANLARKRAKGLPETQLCSCAFYLPSDQQRLLMDQSIYNRMNTALEQGDFKVYLQPKVSLRTWQVVGAEALVRWFDPEQGFVEPDVFIPVLERNGFITRLDAYMFEQSCILLRRWLDLGLEPVPISVNFSRANLGHNALPQYRLLQQRWKVPPELLEFEFTETLVGENPAYFAELVAQIHCAGFRCSMDDFGSSYSSLHMLQQVPVDVLKLDKSLFDGLRDDARRERTRTVVQSVLEMAHRLGITTVAEGISDQVQLSALEGLPCDMVQGYYFSRPLPADDFQQSFLRKKEE